MSIHIPLPEYIERSLRIQLGDELERRVKEHLAAEWFAEGRLTSGQVAEMLGLGWVEAQVFLRDRGVSMPMTIDDVASDLSDLDV